MHHTLSVAITNDGSPTVFSKQFDAYYHSTHGALQESKHVFIQEGIAYYAQKHHAQEISILEYGFGTGLNAFLALIYAREHDLILNYHGLEGFPIPPLVYSQLNFINGKDHDDFLEIHKLSWGDRHSLDRNMHILKEDILFEDFKNPALSDIVFFDAFAPSCQPFLWGKEIMSVAYDALKPGGILVTFCANGAFKRALKSLGFEIERLKGPPGKREMTRATKLG